MIVKP